MSFSIVKAHPDNSGRIIVESEEKTIILTQVPGFPGEERLYPREIITIRREYADELIRAIRVQISETA